MKSLVTWLAENDGEKTYSALFYFGDTAFFFFTYLLLMMRTLQIEWKTLTKLRNDKR